MYKLFFAGVICLSLFFQNILTDTVFAQEQLPADEKLEAVVVAVSDEKEVEVFDKKQLYQKLELLVKTGSLKDQKIIVENGSIPSVNVIKFKEGDEVVVNATKDMEGNNVFYITDHVRRNSLLWLFIIFAAVTVFIGRWRGLTSLIGMGISFLVIFVFILPRILQGNDPILTALIGSLFIIPVSFYLSHGFNRKTTVAIVGTVVSLGITGILANFFVEAGKLTGFVSEEAGFLQVALRGAVNVKGLLLAGIIIGVLGVLDDVTVSQSAVVQQLKAANDKLKAGEIYKRAMDVGRDHISSMVNTLVLVYAGAAMPLLLLFVNNPHPFSEVINYEIVANEVIRTLVGSIGLVLAVPITTIIAVLWTGSSKNFKNTNL